MLQGYNTDVNVKGAVYHIQTEDSGESNPFIVTLIYQGGAILARKKSDYRSLLEAGNYQDEVRRIMRQQHRDMIALLKEGRLGSLEAEPEPQPPAHSTPAAPRPLDEAIMRFLAEVGD